jgi:adenine-specific DNA-methyltransferase
VIQGDCLEVMRGMPDSSVDLICADPPYYKVKGEWWDNQWKTPEAFLSWLSAVAAEWQRLLKPNGSLYCFASPQMAGRVEVMLGERLNVLNHIVWDKSDTPTHALKYGDDRFRQYVQKSERVIFAEQKHDEYAEAERLLHIEIFSQAGRRIAAMREAAGLERWQVDVACSPSKKPTGLCYRWESGDCLPSPEQYEAICTTCSSIGDYEALRDEFASLRPVFESRREAIEHSRRPFSVSADVPFSDVWAFPATAISRGRHPCEKPQGILRHIISASTRPAGLVLDPFAGSGSTGEAALALGRSFIGIEISEEWAAKARERLTPKPDLFTATVSLAA